MTRRRALRPGYDPALWSLLILLACDGPGKSTRDADPATLAASGGAPERADGGSAGQAGAVGETDCAQQNCVPLEMPNWPMPNSRSLPLPNPPNYDLAIETVRDRVTGLSWTRQHSELTDFDGARRWCREFSAQGLADFRLPTRIELVSLLDTTRTPAIEPGAFPNTPSDYFWTASRPPERPDARYSVYFGAGETALGIEAIEGAHTRCVKDGRRALAPRFRWGDDWVEDLATGLIWQRIARPRSFDLAGARAQCGSLSDGADARLPSVKELQTLVDSTEDAVLIDPEAFPEATPVRYWAEGGRDDEPFGVDFSDGTAVRADRFDELRLRCVL